MTNSGGRDPTDPIQPIKGGSAKVDGAAPTGAANPAEGAEGAEATAAVAGADATNAVGGADAIAQALQSGAIDPAQAKAQLIEEAVRSQLGDGAAPELVASVRAEVEALLAADPVFDRLLGTQG